MLTERDGIEPARALAAARAAQGHVGRARRLALDASAAKRRADVLRVPSVATSLGPALSAAAALVRTAEEEAKAVTEELDEPEREALRRAFGEGSSGKGVAKAMRGMAGAMKDLEDRQKSRATRVKRDTLDQALLELALFYRDILMLQLGAEWNSPRPRVRPAQARLRLHPRIHPPPPPGHHALPRAPHPQRRPPARRRRNGPLPLRRLTPQPTHPHPSSSALARTSRAQLVPFTPPAPHIQTPAAAARALNPHFPPGDPRIQ